MRIALTGFTGLIGASIGESLRSAGHSIVRVGRAEGSDVHLDLASDAKLPDSAFAGCDALVHAAGVTDEDFADREAAFAKSRRGASNLLAAAHAAGVRRLVYVSSAHVYGPLEGRIDEASSADPRSDYAVAHHETEQLFRQAADEAGGAALLVRPCAVYGMPPALERFARWSLIPFDFPRQALAGRIVLKSHGLQRRNFVPAAGLGYLAGWWLGQDSAGTTVANAPGRTECPVYEFAALCARIVREECAREVAIERSAASGMPPPPLEYRTRVGGHLPGPSLEDHVRALVRALCAKAPS